MNRYIDLSMLPCNMTKNEAGEWVRYSEAEGIIERKDKKIERFRKALESVERCSIKKRIKGIAEEALLEEIDD